MVTKALAWSVGVVLVGGGVLLLRNELMTVHEDVPADFTTNVVVSAETTEDPALREEMTRGLVSTCRLLVNADVVETSFQQLGPSRFTFDLQPALDEFDRREMRGCLQDARVQHLKVKVHRLETAAPD